MWKLVFLHDEESARTAMPSDGSTEISRREILQNRHFCQSCVPPWFGQKNRLENSSQGVCYLITRVLSYHPCDNTLGGIKGPFRLQINVYALRPRDVPGYTVVSAVANVPVCERLLPLMATT